MLGVQARDGSVARGERTAEAFVQFLMLADWIEAQALDAALATGPVLTKVLTTDKHRVRRQLDAAASA
jgi:hypothetical protein